MAQLFLIAVRNLIQHSRRTLLLGGALTGVTALLVFLICLSAGIHATMFESATTLATGEINVAGFFKVTAGQSAPIVTGYPKLEEIVRKTLPDLVAVVPRGRGWGKIVSETSSMQVGVAGINLSREPDFKRVIHLVSGRIDDLAQPNTVLLFQAQAKKLDAKVGDALVLSSQTPRGTTNTVDLRVVAIAQDVGIMSMWNIFVPDDSLRALYQLNSTTTGALQVFIRDIKDIPRDLDLLTKAYAAAGYPIMDRESKAFWMKMESVNREDWTGQKLDLTTWEDEVSFLKWTITAIDGLMYILITVLLIIIAIGIMNSMWIAIRERTREIGTLRAIGMQRPRVLLLFVIEAFTLGALGTCAGTLIGLAAAGALNAAHLHVPEGAQLFLMSSTFTLRVELARVLLGMGVITGCTTLISVIPSVHAARLKPITAMQHIG